MSVGGVCRTLIRGLLCHVAVPAAALSFVLIPAGFQPAAAQALAMGDYTPVKPKAGEQMLVEAEELVYDYDRDTISAVGNVKIYYMGYTLEADRVTYAKGNSKLMALGNVKMTDPSGMVIYANDIDITQDFRDGFVDSLRVETPENTYFAAERAERTGGETTTFVNGVYTACEPCEEKPDKPPLWQIKAKRIVVDDTEKMVYFQDASFEFMGLPLAWVPKFSIADPSVKRKTGFLAPAIGYSEDVGWSFATPYFIALAPNYDVTLTPAYYTEQGFLGAVEWRQRLRHGQFTLQMAGIDQQNPENFLTSSGGGTFAQRDFRGGARFTGQYALSRDWTLGWDGTISTDRTFTQNYNVLNEDKASTLSQAYLTGLKDRNYFDARVQHWQILADSTAGKYDQDRQADVLPVIDSDYIFDAPILGGELALRSNLTNLTRESADPFDVNGETFYHGLAGDYLRVTEELEWQKKMVLPGGQLLTTFASARGDFYSMSPNDTGGMWPDLTTNDTPVRFMPTIGAEWSLPILARAGNSSHVFEPIVQVVARPDEPYAGELPNDDAQSLVFDDSILFRRDKFSGLDRVEGGTRMNYGLRYIGTFSNNLVLEGLFGQSRMLSGQNSFAVKDMADVGAYSGLETDVSDYVGRVSIGSPTSKLIMRGRFDESTFEIQRAEVEASQTIDWFSASAAYGFIRDVPTAGIDQQQFVNVNASATFADSWRLFGSAVYDVEHKSVSRNSIGLAYDDSCVSLSIAYSETRNTLIPDRQLTVRLLLRTLAEGTVNANVSGLTSTN
jgi:LPS-assembly protein